MMRQQEKSSLACLDTPSTVAASASSSPFSTIFSTSTLAQLPLQLLPQRVHPPEALDKLLSWQSKFVAAIPERPHFAVAIAAPSTAMNDGVSIELRQSLELQSAAAVSVAVSTDILLPANLEQLLASNPAADFFVFASAETIFHPSALFVLMKEVLHLVDDPRVSKSRLHQRQSPPDADLELADLFFANDVCLHPDNSVTYFRKESLSVSNPVQGSRYTALGVNYFQSFVALSRRAVLALIETSEEGLVEFAGLVPSLQPMALGMLALAEGFVCQHIPLGLACVRVASPSEAEIADQITIARSYARRLELFGPADASRVTGSDRTSVQSNSEIRTEIWSDRLFLAFNPPDPGGKVQVVVPFRDQIALTIQCVQSLLKQSIAADLEITLVNNGSSDDSLNELESFLAEARSANANGSIKVLTDPGYFNFARLNNTGAAESNSPFLLFLNNDVQVGNPEALSVLRAWCALRDVGLVGGRLNYPSGAVQHAGINFSPFGPLNLSLPEHGTLFPREANGVTFAMGMIKRCAFEEIGGLDELRCPNGFGDALLAFELRKIGWRTVFTPQATGIHFESASRGASPEEIERYEMVRAGLDIPCHYEDFQVYSQPMFIKPHALSASPVYSFAKRLAGNERVRRAILGAIRRLDAIRRVDRLLPKAK